MGELKPLDPDLTRESYALADALRGIFDGLGISVRRYAARRMRDPGALSRYLNGTRVPPWEVVTDLLTDLGEQRGAPPKPETIDLLRTLHRRAVQANPSPRHGVELLQDQLAQADRESRVSKEHRDVLGEALLDRRHRIADLEVRLHQLEAEWVAERARAEALAQAAPDLAELIRDRDRLQEEVKRLAGEAREAELRRARAEERCALLERQLLSLEGNAAEEGEVEVGVYDAAPLDDPPPLAGAQQLRMPRVLLVDDQADNRFAMTAVLETLDQEIVTVSSGREALKALLDHDDFAVILLDVQMPGMDGYETAAHIKRRPRTRDIPIIFLTAMGVDPEHSARGYAAGAVDYIGKPCDPWALRAKVAVFTGIHLERIQRTR
ncbi:response regulator [Streptomyces sp. NPDC053542]|uniref:response regulator n=1 Tax=Streptomyces sp. NPDC053542 TaxID=3365710 RepID=UPI0037D469C5